MIVRIQRDVHAYKVMKEKNNFPGSWELDMDQGT